MGSEMCIRDRSVRKCGGLSAGRLAAHSPDDDDDDDDRPLLNVILTTETKNYFWKELSQALK